MPYVERHMDQPWPQCPCQRLNCCGDPACLGCHPYGYPTQPAASAGGGSAARYSPEDRMFHLERYGYKPTPLWKGGRGNTPRLPFYGMEIEITCPSMTIAGWAQRNFGRDLVYLKADSSVHGFEMVTHPMTYEWAMENFPWDLLKDLAAQGCSVIPASNGIHVHVSRIGFDSDAHTYRWFKLVYRNAADFKRLARRDSSWGSFNTDHQKGQYAHLRDRKGKLAEDNAQLQRATEIAQESYRAQRRAIIGRYDLESAEQYAEAERAVNALDSRWKLRRASMQRQFLTDTTSRMRGSAINTTVQNTFEVRAFASTLDPVSAQSTIGLVAATIEYTRHLTAHDAIQGGLGWPKFREFLAAQPIFAPVKYADEHCVAPGTHGRAAILG